MENPAWHTDAIGNGCPYTFQPSQVMRRTVAWMMCGLWVISTGSAPYTSSVADNDTLAFAVITEVPKNKIRVPAKIAIEGSVTDTVLLASDQILSNLTWKQLEICHALKLEGQKSSEGFRVVSVRAIDGAMLPMALQGIEGDCLLKKALEVAPLVD